MKRDYNDSAFYGNLIFYAPLTNNGTDIIRGKIPVVQNGSVEYTDDGVVLNGAWLHYDIPFAEETEAKTFACTIVYTSLPYPYSYAYTFGSSYNNSFRDGTCVTSYGKLYKTVSYSSNRYDKDVVTSMTAARNTAYRICTVFERDAQKFYVNEELVWSNYAHDSFNGFGSTDGLLNIGNNYSSTPLRRNFHGIIRDFKIFNIPLSQTEISMI